jgi:hypothetical protein
LCISSASPHLRVLLVVSLRRAEHFTKAQPAKKQESATPILKNPMIDTLRQSPSRAFVRAATCANPARSTRPINTARSTALRRSQPIGRLMGRISSVKEVAPHRIRRRNRLTENALQRWWL